MCGIAGWVDWEKDLRLEESQVKKMTRTLFWRGPDAEGYWFSKRAGLGHRRLIVLDPEGGIQPFVIKEGNNTYVLVYNGELYNFMELRQELQSKGHHFRTRGDTEVVLRAYLEWGIDAPKRFNGIFAFAIWDEAKQELILARDHIGIKPLFYAKKGNSILFGSEIKALLAHREVRREITAEGLAEVLAVVSRSPGHGIYRDISEILPGQIVQFHRNGKRESFYWQLESKPHTDDLETTVSTIRELLYDTVKRQLIADVPVVSLVSGGLDSSGLTAIAAAEYRKQGKSPLHTYSIDFLGSVEDFQEDYLRPSLDTPWINRVVRHCQTKHHTVNLDTYDLIEYADVPFRAHDFPGLGEYEVSLHLLCKQIKKDATVALSGESADEVFGGYPWYHDDQVLNTPMFPWIRLFLGENQYNKLTYLSEECHRLIRPIEYLHDQYNTSISKVPRLPGEDARAARVRELFYLNMTRMLAMLLHRKDQMSMSVGLEVRVPFCDPRLIQYVWNIPWEMKNIDGMEKGILRRALAEVLPDDVRNRKKSAYPQIKNKNYLHWSQQQMQQILDDPHSPLAPFVNKEEVQRVIIGNAVATEISAPIEHMIQVDRWLREYNIEIKI
jgi:asparagine synthase (glutamine-hydrolysing)